MFQFKRVLFFTFTSLSVACAADPATSRLEAHSWLSENWQLAEPHAWRLLGFCGKHDGDLITAGSGTSGLPAHEEEEIGRELRAANASLLTCRSDEVRLDLGAGAEGQIDFYAAYFYLPSLVLDDFSCTEEAFANQAEGVCMTRIEDHWYIGIRWLPRET